MSTPARWSGRAVWPSAAALALFAAPARAAEVDAADTAWLLTASALVLMMTLPGLALFYGGLVRGRSLLSVFAQCLGIAAVVSVLWPLLAYAVAFGDGGPLWGGLSPRLLSPDLRDAVSGSVPEAAFAVFQLTFAVITPALVAGAWVERIRFSAVLLWSALWLLLVYAPVAHWIWGGGFLQTFGTLDFAGGLVVHATAGAAAVAVALVLGARRGFPAHLSLPHAPGLTAAGAGLLWVGWFGFNGGSALAAGADAAMAVLVTHTAAATACLVWMLVEWVRFGRPSVVGAATGVIAGLATITPASGFVGVPGALVLGTLAALLCSWAIEVIKQRLHIDDSLDVMAVHGVGGILGTLLLPFLMVRPLGGTGLGETGLGRQLLAQMAGVVVAFVWSFVISWLLAKLCAATVGLRTDAEAETEGLDLSEHGESAWNF